MLISCEKCSTTYVLDETLIPASGAAVQCTRCSHVFTAFPPKPDAQATVLEEEPTTTKRRTPAAAGIPQGGRPANQTMVFGTGAAPAPAAPQAPAGRPANQTMMFGGGAAVPPPQQPPPPQPRAANQTMVFGTPAGQQAAQQPAPSQGHNANQTLVFGASPVAPPAAAANPHQTLVFGTAAGQQAAAREPAPHANAPANQTLVFGNSPVAPPAGNANQTLVFGTAAGQAATQPQAAAPSGAANQTLVFGATPVAPPSARSTQMFGAAQTPAPAAPPPPAQRPSATTVMFGAGQLPPPAAPASNKAPNTTMMFGKPPEAVAAAATRTMAFGTPVVTPPKKPLPQVTQGTVELSGEAEPEQRSESTVRVDLERMMREHGEGGEESQESVEQRHDRTQRFAMTDSSATNPGETAESVQDRHNRTALFAMSTLQETTKPDAKAPGANTAPDLHGVAEPTIGFDQPLDSAQTIPPGNSTLIHGSLNFNDDPPGVSTLMEPGGEDMRATVRHDGPIASTMPNLAPITHDATDAAHRAPLRLDIISSPALAAVAAPDTLQGNDSQVDAGVEALAAQGRRRNIVAIVIVLLLVLAVALGVFWQFFGKQLLTKDLDPRLVQVSEQALTQFRKEDSQLRGTEIERLAAIVKENPSFVDGHAALVLGLGLECDDLYGERAFVDYRYTVFKKLMEGVKDDTKKGEFGKRANEMVARSEALTKPTESAVGKLDASMKAMDAALRSGAAPSQSGRARAFGFALRAGQATAVDEGSDYWARLASALAVLYAPKSTPEALKAALDDVQKLSAEDDQLARPHFVAARLHLALGDEAQAIASLDKAIKVAPKFTAAADSRKLLDQLK